jgi:hypothetical protein
MSVILAGHLRSRKSAQRVAEKTRVITRGLEYVASAWQLLQEGLGLREQATEGSQCGV